MVCTCTDLADSNNPVAKRGPQVAGCASGHLCGARFHGPTCTRRRPGRYTTIRSPRRRVPQDTTQLRWTAQATTQARVGVLIKSHHGDKMRLVGPSRTPAVHPCHHGGSRGWLNALTKSTRSCSQQQTTTWKNTQNGSAKRACCLTLFLMETVASRTGHMSYFETNITFITRST